MPTALTFPSITGVTGAPNMPNLTEVADIQTALKLLYFGSTGAAVTTDGIYGALHRLYVGNPTLAGSVTITGDLTVNGTTTTINVNNLLVEDQEIVLGNVTTPSNTTANGGGIRLEAGTDVDKTITWDSTNANWTSSENFNLSATKVFRIGGTTEVLSATKVLGRTPGGTTAGDIATIDASQTLTNKTLSSPTITGATVRPNTAVTYSATPTVVDASSGTELYALTGAYAAAVTINISNLTAGRQVKMYLRNTAVSQSTVTIAASTTTSSHANVNMQPATPGGASVTSVVLSANTGTAVVTVFNAGGTIGGSIG